MFTENNHHILIVDDDEQVLFVWRNALEKRFNCCRVETACCGADALDRIQEQAFDLVITDLKMPGMDGVELTNALRHLAPEVPVIWVSGYRSPETEDAARHLAVQDFLDKPLSVAQIRRIVAETLAIRV